MSFLIIDARTHRTNAAPPAQFEIIAACAEREKAKELLLANYQADRAILKVPEDSVFNVRSLWRDAEYFPSPGPSSPGPSPGDAGPKPPEGFRLLWRGELAADLVGKKGRDVLRKDGSMGWPISRSLKGSDSSAQDSAFKAGDTKGSERLVIDKAPDGTVALKILYPKGPVWTMEFRLQPPGMADHRVIETALDFWIPDDFKLPQADEAGWKTFGGPASGDGWGGGSLPDEQKGWGFRCMVSKAGWRYYGYQLNRTSGRFGMQGQFHAMPTGRWVTVSERLRNPSRPGAADAVIERYLDGDLVSVTRDMRLDKAGGPKRWADTLMMQDMGGGDPQEKRQHSPKEQHVWVRWPRVYFKATSD